MTHWDIYRRRRHTMYPDFDHLSSPCADLQTFTVRTIGPSLKAFPSLPTPLLVQYITCQCDLLLLWENRMTEFAYGLKNVCKETLVLSSPPSLLVSKVTNQRPPINIHRLVLFFSSVLDSTLHLREIQYLAHRLYIKKWT